METKEKTEIVQVKKNEEEMEIDLFELMLYYKSRLVFVIGGFFNWCHIDGAGDNLSGCTKVYGNSKVIYGFILE